MLAAFPKKTALVNSCLNFSLRVMYMTGLIIACMYASMLIQNMFFSNTSGNWKTRAAYIYKCTYYAYICIRFDFYTFMHMNTNSVTDTHQHQIQYNQHQSPHCHFYYPVICGKDSSCHEKLMRRPANEKSHHNHHHQSHHLWLWCEGGQGIFPATKTDHTAPQVVPV